MPHVVSHPSYRSLFALCKHARVRLIRSASSAWQPLRAPHDAAPTARRTVSIVRAETRWHARTPGIAGDRRRLTLLAGSAPPSARRDLDVTIGHDGRRALTRILRPFTPGVTHAVDLSLHSSESWLAGSLKLRPRLAHRGLLGYLAGRASLLSLFSLFNRCQGPARAVRSCIPSVSSRRACYFRFGLGFKL